MSNSITESSCLKYHRISCCLTQKIGFVNNEFIPVLGSADFRWKCLFPDSEIIIPD